MPKSGHLAQLSTAQITNYHHSDNRFGYLLPDVDEGKVCFFTGLLAEVPYSVGAGDWGAPITWFDHANNKEWLVSPEINLDCFKIVMRSNIFFVLHKLYADLVPF